MTPSILDEPIKSVSQQRRKSRSCAFHARTWFRVVATLASGKKVTLRRRAINGYSHVALYACPGVDNQPECYLWRLTNGKVPKTFHEGPHNTKWWLLELIPIEVKEEKMKAVRTHEYRIDGYGTVMFIRTHLGSGHCSFKVFWRRAGEENGTRIAWMQEGRKPSAKLAIFWCKVAYAKEDGLDQYHYHDKGLTPPKRMLRERNAA